MVRLNATDFKEKKGTVIIGLIASGAIAILSGFVIWLL